MVRGFKAMAAHLFEHAGISVHPDTLRKAVDDAANPLPVEWDGGFATIAPLKLMRWRKQRVGRRRTTKRAA